MSTVARRRVVPFVASLMGLGIAASAWAVDLVFADVLNDADPLGNSIRLVRSDGSGLTTLIATGGGLRGLDVDNAGFIYWTDVDNFAVRRARFDGSAQQDLNGASVAFPSALRIHAPSGRAYWGDQTSEEIRSVNLDGMFDAPLTPTPFFRGLAFDTVNNRIYWTTSVTAATGQIRSARLDGSDEQIVVPPTSAFFKPGNLAIDAAGGKIYWTDAIARFVRRANLDGTSVQNVFDCNPLGPPKGLTIDHDTGTIYFGIDFRDFDTDSFIAGAIYRCNLDGSDANFVVGGLGSVNDIVISRLSVCFADFNGDGNVTVQDIFDFLASYFANDSLADFNRDGAVSVQDIFDYLAAYFAGCP